MSENKLPTTLYHCSTLSPSMFADGKLKPHRNITIAGETVNAVFADAVSAENNPYVARDAAYGMYCFGNMVVYNNDNIEHKDGKLLLKKPIYEYAIDSTGFEKVENDNAVEYILRDKAVDVESTQVTKISDVTPLCQNH